MTHHSKHRMLYMKIKKLRKNCSTTYEEKRCQQKRDERDHVIVQYKGKEDMKKIGNHM